MLAGIATATTGSKSPCSSDATENDSARSSTPQSKHVTPSRSREVRQSQSGAQTPPIHRFCEGQTDGRSRHVEHGAWHWWLNCVSWRGSRPSNDDPTMVCGAWKCLEQHRSGGSQTRRGSSAKRGTKQAGGGVCVCLSCYGRE